MNTPESFVTLHPRSYATGVRYGWMHQRHPALARYSSEDHATEGRAWQVAAVIAWCKGVPLVAPATVLAQLATDPALTHITYTGIPQPEAVAA
jgi:hypothetical protein